MCNKTIKAIVNPGAAIINKNVSKSNAVRQIADPGGIAVQNAQEGKVHNIADITDPGGVIRPTSEQQQAREDAAAYELDAPNRAANAATDAANNALITAKRKRKMSSLATGAVAGGGLTSSTQAYGKSTLGG